MEIELILRVTDLSRGGAGVAREPNGRVTFIPFSAPGDLVKVRIVEENKRYAQGEIIEILEPSQHRQTPRCPAFGRCGGCQWQHLSYDLQWKTKVAGVLQTLKRAQVALPEKFDQIPAERLWEYRNRIQLRGKNTELGFYKSKSRELVPVNRCDIARPEINRNWEETRTEGNLRKKPYKVEIEVTEEGDIKKSWDSPHSAAGFRQVHDEQNEKLRNWIAKSLTRSEVLYDLFGGSGNLSLPLANKMGEIHCVDLSSPKSGSSEVPANVYFHRSSVVKWLLQRAKRNIQRSGAAAILDPPREGLGSSFSEIASILESLHVHEVVLVGCDPDSWSRDLSRWLGRGWALRRVMLIDLFPQTPHVESVALIQRSETKDSSL